MPDRRLIANAVLFQLGWLACVLGGTSFWLAVPLVALLVGWFSIRQPRCRASSGRLWFVLVEQRTSERCCATSRPTIEERWR